jgi:undecaprenyl-diphosphatase
VARLRPTHNPEIADLIHVVNGYRGGLYGFVSSHSANAFAFVTFLSLFFRSRICTIVFVIWAVLMAYSRVYLGVHYVGDIVCGAILGVFVGLFVYKLFSRKISLISNL